MAERRCCPRRRSSGAARGKSTSRFTHFRICLGWFENEKLLEGRKITNVPEHCFSVCFFFFTLGK